MGQVTDYQFAYFNNIIYNEQDPNGPVSDFTPFSRSGRLESGLAATACIREDQVLTFVRVSMPYASTLVGRHAEAAVYCPILWYTYTFDLASGSQNQADYHSQ